MKIRTDYVTNSSSSSFIVVHKVNDNDELREYMKEEYGKYGIKLLDDLLLDGKDIRRTYNKEDADNIDEYDKNYVYYGDQYPTEYHVNDSVKFEPGSKYIFARHIAWTTDGDREEDDVWLEERIPDKYKEKIYAQNPD